LTARFLAVVVERLRTVAHRLLELYAYPTAAREHR
jgi:hypothetical protein